MAAGILRFLVRGPRREHGQVPAGPPGASDCTRFSRSPKPARPNRAWRYARPATYRLSGLRSPRQVVRRLLHPRDLTRCVQADDRLPAPDG